jgi:hypothetical protein
MHLRVLILSATAAFALPAGAALADDAPIMPLSEVQAGMDCTSETVIQGTTISSFDVHVIGVVQVPGQGPRILVRASGPAVAGTGIAAGFSGSPVYCPDGFGTMRNAGAISQGVGDFGNDDALVTPIEQMLGEPVTPPPAVPRLTARVRSLLGPLTIGGLSPGMLNALQQAGRRVGRVVLASPAGPPASGFPVQPLVPGASVAASYSVGAIPIGAVGTVTYRNGNAVYAFGHELDGAGRRALLLQDAYVSSVIGNPLLGSYKFAAPGHIEGTLTSDTPNAVVGEVGQAPPLVPINVTANDLDTGHTLEFDTQVADETDVGLPMGSSLVDLVAPMAAGQAATQIYNGPPANESGRMCVSVQLRESHGPLQFCNRYVGTGLPGDAGMGPPELATGVSTDLATAFGLLEQVQFATLHVESVTARIDAQRGLLEAAIVGSRAPRRVRPGQLVTVHLLVRRFRGALDDVSLKLRIPLDSRGALTATLDGPPAPGPPPNPASGLTGSLAVLLGGSGPSGPPPPPPTSMATLHSEFAGIANYDGLRIRWSAGKPHELYRDPALLITGDTKLHFEVVRAPSGRRPSGRRPSGRRPSGHRP